MQRDKRNLKQFWSDQPSGSLQSNPLPKAGLTTRPEQAAQHLLLVGSEPIKHKDPPSFPGPIPELHHSNGKTSAAELPLLKLPLAFPTCPSDTATRGSCRQQDVPFVLPPPAETSSVSLSSFVLYFSPSHPS